MASDIALAGRHSDSGDALSIFRTPADRGLDALTRTVVALARHDGLRSVRSSTRISRLLGRLFGLGPVAPLASPRLEAVRQFCVLARYQDARASAQRAMLMELGYGLDEIAVIEAILG